MEFVNALARLSFGGEMDGAIICQAIGGGIVERGAKDGILKGTKG